MSLCLAVVAPEGIALAGDSRQTQVVNNIHRVSSDNAEKVFRLNNRVMAATAGYAFLKAPGQNHLRNIASLMADVQTTIPANGTLLGL